MPRHLVIGKGLVGELTVGELELLEERTGRPLSRLFEAEAPRGTLLRALAYIALRREEPETTWESVEDVVVELEDAEGVVSSTGPTDGRGKLRGSSTTSRSRTDGSRSRSAR